MGGITGSSAVSASNGITGNGTALSPLVIDTSFGAIGTTARLMRFTSSKSFPNSTHSGSNLFYISATVAGSAGGSPGRAAGNRVGASSSFVADVGNSGVGNATFTPMTGTWRLLDQTSEAIYDACGNYTYVMTSNFIRIS